MRGVTLLLIAIFMMAFSYQERDVKFKYCRVEVVMKDGGMVADVNGVIILTDRMIIIRSNNDKPDVLFNLQKEVSPEWEGNDAWLANNTEFPDSPMIIEYGVGIGIKMIDLTTKDYSFFFAKEIEESLESLPEKNKWFIFPKGGGEIKTREID